MERPSIPSTSPTLLSLLRSPIADERAWTTLLERYRPLIEWWLQRAGLQAADADEVQSRVQLSLVIALRQFNYDPAHRFRGWLRTVVNNAVRNFWRERGRKPWTQGSGDEAVQEQLEQIPEPIQRLAEELDDCLQHDLRLAHRVVAYVQERVEPRTWQAFWLTAIDNKPAQDVAAELEMSVAAVYMAKSRVIQKLRESASMFIQQLGDERDKP